MVAEIYHGPRTLRAQIMTLVWSLMFLVYMLVFAVVSHSAQLSACGAGVTTCSNDTANNTLLNGAIQDPSTQLRVWAIWVEQCGSVFTEAATTTGHAQRVAFCQSIDAGFNRVPGSLLVASILNPTTIGEILAAASPQTPAGDLVDADVVTQIGAVLTVASASAATTATQATSGLNYFTVASATGIIPGQLVYCAVCANNTTVVYVLGTTVYLSLDLTGTISSGAVTFAPLLFGLATRGW